jgi:hypothetical protein
MKIAQDDEVAEEEEQVDEVCLNVLDVVEEVIPVNIAPGTGIFFCLPFSAFCVSVLRIQIDKKKIQIQTL